jgi:Fe-S cluster assembly protein SufD
MTTQVAEQTDRAQYLADFDTLMDKGAPDWLRDVRNAGAAAFSNLEFPHYKEEAWRKTDIKPILRSTFCAAERDGTEVESIGAMSYAEHGYIELVFVDGYFSPTLSTLDLVPGNVRIAALSEAFVESPVLFQTHLNAHVENTNAFVPLNTAFVQDGAYIEIPKNTVIDTPIHVLYISTSESTVVTHPRNLFVIGESSEVNIVESYVGLEGTGAYLTNGVTEIVVGDNANVTRYKVVEEGPESYHLMTTQVVEGRDSSFKSYTISLSGKIIRNELRLKLAGENGNCDLNGLYLNDEDRTIDNALFVEHAVSRCYSRMAYKGVLDGSSQSVFTGKVLVPPNSQQTDSDQLNNNLLLSDKATIDTNPQLEIFADDVKCTHGATIGSFPSELVFYFQSRGMDPKAAFGILTYGFAAEVVDGIGLAPLKERLAEYVFNKYSPR